MVDDIGGAFRQKHGLQIELHRLRLVQLALERACEDQRVLDVSLQEIVLGASSGEVDPVAKLVLNAPLHPAAEPAEQSVSPWLPGDSLGRLLVALLLVD